MDRLLQFASALQSGEAEIVLVIGDFSARIHHMSANFECILRAGDTEICRFTATEFMECLIWAQDRLEYFVTFWQQAG